MRYIERAEEFQKIRFYDTCNSRLQFCSCKSRSFIYNYCEWYRRSRKVDILLDLSILKSSFLRDFGFFGKKSVLLAKADAARAAPAAVARIVPHESVAPLARLFVDQTDLIRS